MLNFTGIVKEKTNIVQANKRFLKRTDKSNLPDRTLAVLDKNRLFQSRVSAVYT
jgi:hypothetical protein